jgi:glycerol-3-phosphate dehydrogenase (NAD(P)+)
MEELERLRSQYNKKAAIYIALGVIVDILLIILTGNLELAKLIITITIFVVGIKVAIEKDKYRKYYKENFVKNILEDIYDRVVYNPTKGIEESTLKTQVEILEELLPTATLGALSGPTHAEEVILGLPTTIVSASENREMAEYVQNVFMAPNFRVYTSPDVLGVELGGSLKNVIALAAGIAAGLGYGDNAMAALITRGIHEMVGLAGRMGASYETLYGLSGIGDLIVTCESKHSRNRKAGVLIGQGMSMQDAMKEVGQVVEGVYSAKAALTLSQKYGVNLPITNEVNKVLFEGKNPGQAVMDLMTRDKKMENFVSEEELPKEWKDL